MAAPSLKDLPKVAVDLKSQLESFSSESLKNANTEEKVLLPTLEGKKFLSLSKFCGSSSTGSLIHIQIYINFFSPPKCNACPRYLSTLMAN